MIQKHIPRKRFGQNFLIDTHVIADIIATINPKHGEHIVEIGPGQGALTKGLVASGANIDAIELDRDLAAILTSHFHNNDNFKLHSADILNFNLSSLCADNVNDKLKVVGNLPYNISTPLLFKLFENISIISSMYFMLQREVAERLTASHNSKEYGKMSVMAQYYCDMQILIDVPPNSFNPAPKVHSSVVYFKPHNPSSIINLDTKILYKVTTQAFNQRRKTITNSLKNIISSQELNQLNIDPMQRAENLVLEDYAKITNYLKDQ